jgi:hypothetical protein
MNKTFKVLIIMVMAVSLLTPLLSVHAAAVTSDFLMNGGNAAVNISTASGLSSTDPRTIAAKIINIALGILGILAVVLILLGGFKWMTAAGNEEQIEEAKKILTGGVIGLVIILASWGLATFIINSLVSATS